MKRAIVFLMILTLALFYSSVSMAAEDTALNLTAAASSSYFSSFGIPADAVDNNESTYWIGGFNKSPWWITFDTWGTTYYITTINIMWQSTFYTPTDYDIQISSDGVTWTNVYSHIKGSYSAQGETKDINKTVRFVRLYIRQVRYYCPMIKEVKICGRKNPSRLMRVQGNLKDIDRTPLDGLFTLTFRIYDVETGGAALWQETQNNINIEEGLLSVELGSVKSLDLPFDKKYWLSAQVESDVEMSPRFKLTGVPYSFTLQ